jgi:hypothetical protein
MPEILSRYHQLKLFRVRPGSLERKPYRRRFEEPKDSVSIRSRRIGSRTAAIHNLTSIRREKSMSLSLYEITIPVMIAGFGNMSRFLDRGRAYADEKGIAHVKLLNARLADDMMSLVEQVQPASDTAKRAAVRWAWLTTLRCRTTKQPSRICRRESARQSLSSQRCRRPRSNDRQTPS